MRKIDFNSKSFLVLLAVVTMAFIWIIQPFLTTILWACILAIAFFPLHQRFNRYTPNWPSLAAFFSICVCTFLLVIPFILLTMFLVQESLSWYQSFQANNLDLTHYFSSIYEHLPGYVLNLLKRFDINSAQQLHEALIQLVASTGQFVTSQLINFGQNTISVGVQIVIIIYLMFFLFRDGQRITEGARQVIPIDPTYIEKLIDNFTTVVLATVKGSLVIAILQGMAGGLMLWAFAIPNVILWSAVMAVLSLLPVVGASIVWGPIAIYFIATGNMFSGITMIIIGSVIIGLMDNFLRPILVGKSTKLPDYVVLITTIGGIYLFGFIGFVLGPVIAALFVSGWTFFGELQASQTFSVKHKK